MAYGLDPDAGAGSVRPPDLPPEDVTAGADVLADWDHGVGPAEVASWRADRPPPPLDALLLIGGVLLGGGLAAALGRSGVKAGLLGAGTGAVLVAAVRRPWRLPG